MKLDVDSVLEIATSRKVDLARLIRKLDFTEAEVPEKARTHHNLLLDALSFRTAVAVELLYKKQRLKSREIEVRDRLRKENEQAGNKRVALTVIAEKASIDPRVMKLQAQVSKLEVLDEYAKSLLRVVDGRMTQLRMSVDHQKIESYAGVGANHVEDINAKLKRKYPGAF